MEFFAGMVNSWKPLSIKYCLKEPHIRCGRVPEPTFDKFVFSKLHFFYSSSFIYLKRFFTYLAYSNNFFSIRNSAVSFLIDPKSLDFSLFFFFKFFFSFYVA